MEYGVLIKFKSVVICYMHKAQLELLSLEGELSLLFIMFDTKVYLSNK